MRRLNVREGLEVCKARQHPTLHPHRSQWTPLGQNPFPARVMRAANCHMVIQHYSDFPIEEWHLCPSLGQWVRTFQY